MKYFIHSEIRINFIKNIILSQLKWTNSRRNLCLCQSPMAISNWSCDAKKKKKKKKFFLIVFFFGKKNKCSFKNTNVFFFLRSSLCAYAAYLSF